MGSSSRFEKLHLPGRACLQLNSANQIARPGGHQPRLQNCWIFPIWNASLSAHLSPVVTNARARRLYYLPSQDEALSFVPQC